MAFATIDSDQQTTDAEPDLASVLDNGGWLRTINVPDLLLPDGEPAYADFWATGWRYEAAVVPYERRTVVMGGPLMALATWAASALGNRRRRASAEADSAPQWRPLGQIRVVVTSSRLLVLHGGAWWSVWYSEILRVDTSRGEHSIDLRFRADAPYRLCTHCVGDLSAVIGDLMRPSDPGDSTPPPSQASEVGAAGHRTSLRWRRDASIRE